MIASLQRILPWMNGFFAYLAWRLGGALVRLGRRRAQPPFYVQGPVCVLQTGALGDVLMTTPLLQALIARLGMGEVDVVVTERTAELLQNIPGLGRIITISGPLRCAIRRRSWNTCERPGTFAGTATRSSSTRPAPSNRPGWRFSHPAGPAPASGSRERPARS